MPVAARVTAFRRSHANLPGPMAGTVDPPLTVTFPTVPLYARILIAPGADLTADPSTWVWYDITTRVRMASGVTTSQGRPDETSLVQTGSASLTLDNRDGLFSRRNPSSPLYGRLSLNTPIWGTIDPGSGEVTRLAMFVTSWPNRWDRSGNDTVVQIQCAGILRRLMQGKTVKSPLRRTITAAAPDLYWALEDSGSATQAASGLVDGKPMTATGNLLFGAQNQCAGTALSVDFGLGGSLTIRPDTVATNSETVSLVSTWDTAVTGTTLDVSMQPGNASIHLYTTAGVLNADIAAIGGAFTLPGPTVSDGLPHHIVVTLHDNGIAVVSTLFVDGASVATHNVVSTLSLSPLGVTLNTGGAVNGPVVSHLGLWHSLRSINLTSAVAGYVGEQAHTRIVRNCGEENIPLLCNATVSPAMGAQPIDGIVEVVRDAELVDTGVLYETNWGLGYQSLEERTNADVDLALDFNQAHIAVEPEPADDDQRILNRVTVKRDGGSEATAESATGAMGTQAGGPGTYDDEVTLNVEDDSELQSQANQRLHLGQVDEDRWPAIALRLHGTPGLIGQWSTMPFGGRIQASNPPPQVAPQPIDGVMEGFTESWTPLTWEAVATTSPSSPYEVFQIDSGDDNRSRIPASDGGTTTDDRVQPGDTSIDITSQGTRWIDSTNYASDFPVTIQIAGEVMVCTAISGTSLSQTMTVTRALYGTALTIPAGSAVQLFRPPVVALTGE